MKWFMLAIQLVLLVSFSPPAEACPDCQDEVCVPPFGPCACVPNVGRCPAKVPRHDFCNITTNGPGEKASCKNCSSLLSGDAGKADCLVRQQGHQVNSGQCNPADCRTIASTPPTLLFAAGGAQGGEAPAVAGLGTPVLRNATKVEIKSIVADGLDAKATANVTTIDGEEQSCSYDLTLKKAPGRDGLQLFPKSESCAKVQ